VDVSVLVVVAVLGAGMGLADTVVGRREASRGERLLAAAAWGPGMIAGLLSLTAFASLVVGLGAAGRPTLLASVAAAAIGAAVLHRVRPAHGPPAPRPGTGGHWTTAAGWLVLAAVTLGVGWSFLRWLALRPLGSWDGMGIWTYRALQWFRAGDAFPGVLRLLVESKPGYPLLLPGLVAAELTLWGRETTVIPVATGGLFVVGAAAATALAVSRRAPAALAPAAAALLLSTPMVWQSAFAQGADLALASLAVVAALGLADLVDRGRSGAPAPAWLVGLVLGLMVWTKDEGAILATLLAGTAVVVSRVARRPLGPSGWLGIGAGAAPGIVATAVLKTSWTTGGEVGRYLVPELWSRLADPSRWQTVASAFAARLVPGSGEALWGATVVLLVGLAAVALARRPAPAAAVAAALFGLPVVLALAADAAIYLITPDPLEWHLRTSLDRLGLQLLPLAIVAVMVALGDEDQDRAAAPAPSGVR
jgi:hypothetical protein